MTRIKNALLVLIGRYKVYNPKTHFISRYSVKSRARKVKDKQE